MKEETSYPTILINQIPKICQWYIILFFKTKINFVSYKKIDALKLFENWRKLSNSQ
ncbi:hypothetical protein LEP1GSC043_0128 [Leptospira weilii str. Ecochallenge]|uniref:Uncharacterized protein n=1 Tax=Leptospira weilii str. Ecochallenge TaxID=1049986 RepID=N1U570_9LEPT|nr:hypothetical protein LEP1GSC043_0128 [Leptospira weilii str. Ecochallenge]